jgi:hypothetical protein
MHGKIEIGALVAVLALSSSASWAQEVEPEEDTEGENATVEDGGTEEPEGGAEGPAGDEETGADGKLDSEGESSGDVEEHGAEDETPKEEPSGTDDSQGGDTVDTVDTVEASEDHDMEDLGGLLEEYTEDYYSTSEKSRMAGDFSASFDYRQWKVGGETHHRAQSSFGGDLLFRVNRFGSFSPLIGAMGETSTLNDAEYISKDSYIGPSLGIGSSSFLVAASGGYFWNHQFRRELVEKTPETGEALYTYDESLPANGPFLQSYLQFGAGDFGLRTAYMKEWATGGERAPGEGWSEDWRGSVRLNWTLLALGYEYQSRADSQEHVYSLVFLTDMGGDGE